MVMLLAVMPMLMLMMMTMKTADGRPEERVSFDGLKHYYCNYFIICNLYDQISNRFSWGGHNGALRRFGFEGELLDVERQIECVWFCTVGKRLGFFVCLLLQGSSSF